MSLTLERIEALAPDQSSLVAARKLLKPSTWPTLAEGEGLVWGECQSSGATPYRVVVKEADAGYKCTCPSRKFPCKHTLALMWMRADESASFAPATVPDWRAVENPQPQTSLPDRTTGFLLTPLSEPLPKTDLSPWRILQWSGSDRVLTSSGSY